MARVTDQTLFQLIHDFLKVYMPLHRCTSPNTIKAYRTSLELLLDFTKQQKNVSLAEVTFEMLNCQMITDFLNHLECSRGCSIATRNQRLACIRSFFRYASSMEPTTVVYQIALKKIPQKKAVAAVPKFMSEAAVKALLEQPDTSTAKGLRDQFFMILIYDTAARVGEILNLRVKDIHTGATPTATLYGKGSKVRTVPLMKKTMEHFRSYIRVFHPDANCFSEEYLFYVVRDGQKRQMSDDNIQKFMKAYGLSARQICSEVPDNVHPHLWRHSRAMHLYQHGMDLTLISQWLGHAQLDTTLIYSHADTEQKRKAIEQSMDSNNPLVGKGALLRYQVDDEEVLKKLYGLK